MAAFGVKTNEGARPGTHEPGERPGTRAQVKYVRMSAYKARQSCSTSSGARTSTEADAILRFTEREAARVIRKCLLSAVANAQNNEGIDPETLYVSACFVDEGMTIKRWQPRARGRATRIRKRTCHITVIVSPYRRRRARAPSRPRRGPRRSAAPAAPAPPPRPAPPASPAAAAAAAPSRATEPITTRSADDADVETPTSRPKTPTDELAAETVPRRPTDRRGDCRMSDEADDARRRRGRGIVMGQKVNPYGFRLGVTTDWK